AVVLWGTVGCPPAGAGRPGPAAAVPPAPLSLGVHRVTAPATDRAGLIGSDERIVLVEPPPAGTAGFHDFRFGPTVEFGVQKATAEKPESKLWYNDGIWWATLFRPSPAGHR